MHTFNSNGWALYVLQSSKYYFSQVNISSYDFFKILNIKQLRVCGGWKCVLIYLSVFISLEGITKASRSKGG